MVEKLRKIAFPAYLIFLILSFLYISSILQEGSIPLSKKGAEEKATEVHPAKVTLIVYETKTLTSQDVGKTYEARLTTQDTISDFLDKLRSNKQFFFEKTLYIDHIELTDVDHEKTPDGYMWRLFNDKWQDITDNFEQIYLKDTTTSYLKLVNNPK